MRYETGICTFVISVNGAFKLCPFALPTMGQCNYWSLGIDLEENVALDEI